MRKALTDEQIAFFERNATVDEMSGAVVEMFKMMMRALTQSSPENSIRKVSYQFDKLTKLLPHAAEDIDLDKIIETAVWELREQLHDYPPFTCEPEFEAAVAGMEYLAEVVIGENYFGRVNKALFHFRDVYEDGRTPAAREYREQRQTRFYEQARAKRFQAHAETIREAVAHIPLQPAPTPKAAKPEGPDGLVDRQSAPAPAKPGDGPARRREMKPESESAARFLKRDVPRKPRSTPQ